MYTKYLIIALFFITNLSSIHSQTTIGVTGLLHMPNAEMQNDGTFMFGGNFLNKKNLPSDKWWGHNTYNYFINITFLKRLEISYICTLVKGKNNGYWPQQTWGRFTNQDRHFAAKIQVIKEGEWWVHMPSLVLGVNDPTTASQKDGTYYDKVSKTGNGYFNKWYIAITKNYNIHYGELGVHTAYLYNERLDYPLNGIAFGINFRPNFHKNLNVIAEYDAKTFNVGVIYSLWADHFNFLFELQDGKYISCGLVYKVNLKGGNRWKSGILDY